MAGNSSDKSQFFDDASQVDAYYKHVMAQPPGRSTVDIMEWPIGRVCQILKASSLTHNADSPQAATGRPISVDIDDLFKRPQPALRVMLVVPYAGRYMDMMPLTIS